MRKIFVILIAFVISAYAEAWNRRHIIILQDNSGSFYHQRNESLITDVQNHVYQLFNNEKINKTYSLLNNEIDQGGVFFDSKTDDVSFWWFVADQKGNVSFYRNTGGEPEEFEKFFLTQGSTLYNKNMEVEAFLKKNFSSRPPLRSADNNNGISTYSFSAYAFPLCMDVLQTDYTEEYIVLIISDFNAGSTFGNRNDEKIFKEAFRNKATRVIQRVNQLNSLFFKIDYFDYYRDTQFNGLIGFVGFKLRPNVGAPVPENLDLRINSDIKLIQQEFGKDKYNLEKAEVIFSHNENLVLKKACIGIELKNSQNTYQIDVTDKIEYDSLSKSYRYEDIHDIVLHNRTIQTQDCDGEFYFQFFMNYEIGENKHVKYVYKIGRSIDNTNIVFRTKLSNAQISMIVFLIFLVLALAIAWILHQQGKPIGLAIRWNRFTDNYETIDFSPEGSGRIHTDYRVWDENAADNGFSIKVEGKLIYKQPQKFYNWKEQTGFQVRITPMHLEAPEGFSLYVATDTKTTNSPEMSIVTDSFENGIFSFKVIVKKNENSPLQKPVMFNVRIEVACRSVGTFRQFYYTKHMSYMFHVGPELGDMWVGVDPGTTGSCIATATDSHDLTIEKDRNGKDRIMPSVIVIKTERLRDDEEESIRAQAMYDIDADRQKESERYRKFVSIKKLLGYNETYPLKEFGNRTLSVKSSFLSTLLIEGLFNQHRKYMEDHVQEPDFARFLVNQHYIPQRAVFAIPNNFTASKIQHLRSCILNSNIKTLKDIRFIYEAEAILVNYLNSSSNNQAQASPDGENIFIFDMGGATINATLANIKKDGDVYDISILAKLGYAIGGDTIDYAMLKWIYSKENSYSELREHNPFRSTSVSMSKRREYKTNILEIKKQLISNYNRYGRNALFDRSDLERYFGAHLIGQKNDENQMNYDNDPFTKEIQKNNNNFLNGRQFEEYVWSNIKSIVQDIITKCDEKGVETLHTLIMSGRSSHFPKVKDTVTSTLNTTFKGVNTILLELEESKSAVAKGACYYGVQNANIRLHNRCVSGVFGVIQTLSPTSDAKPMFHRLVEDGTAFVDGVATGNCDIETQHQFTWDGKKVRFCQVMGVDAEKVIANQEKHKYTEIATIKAEPFAINGVHISITEKDKVICSARDVDGNIKNASENVVNDADIIACNDEQYTFFIKQS